MRVILRFLKCTGDKPANIPKILKSKHSHTANARIYALLSSKSIYTLMSLRARLLPCVAIHFNTFISIFTLYYNKNLFLPFDKISQKCEKILFFADDFKNPIFRRFKNELVKSRRFNTP